MYLPALPNCVSMFQNSTGVWVLHTWHCMTLFFQQLDFQCVGNVCHAQYRQSCIQVSTWGPICLVVCFWNRLSPILKDGGSLSMVFWAVLKQFSSNVFFAMARARQWASKLSKPDSGLPRNCCIASRSWFNGRLGLCHRWEKMVFLLWQGWVSLCSLQELDWCICPNLLYPFHRASWV